MNLSLERERQVRVASGLVILVVMGCQGAYIQVCYRVGRQEGHSLRVTLQTYTQLHSDMYGAAKFFNMLHARYRNGGRPTGLTSKRGQGCRALRRQ